jgi:hypothetical protein
MNGAMSMVSKPIPGAFVVVVAAILAGLQLFGAEPPVIPVGLDAYRQWERWPYQRIGARAYMRSTYDRGGGNESADASHFLYQLSDEFNVSLDVQGPGVLYFTRYNHWHGSPWHYEVDGRDYMVQETSTPDPLHPVSNSIFQPEPAFPNPLTWTWSLTKGADLSWVPITFERSFRLAYSRTRYGTGYYIWYQYIRGAPLSRSLSTWSPEVRPDEEVLSLLQRSGTDLLPVAGSAEARGWRETSGRADLPERNKAVILNFEEGPAVVRALELSAPQGEAVSFGRARLRITWDGRDEPSIDAPVALFFGAGTLYNRDGREYLVKAFPMHIRFAQERVELACYFPMPFFRSARVELLNGAGDALSDIRWRVRAQPFTGSANEVGYFHATYRDHTTPESGHDLVLLDTEQSERSREWSGSFVGTSLIFSDRAMLNTLEGDPRFFFDDSQTPQAYGTGTEEWGGGGDYWGGENMTLPFAGHPTGARNKQTARDDEDQIESSYRFLLADLMPFGRRAVIRLEHGGLNESTERYQTVAYWYGLPAASLVRSDELAVGDAESERAHAYQSPRASPPYEISSRYEWGVDALKGREVYPAHAERGRKTVGTSEFTIRLLPDNLGVLLRRTLDYSFPNQRAEVWVADETSQAHDGDQGWQSAGIWYLAGSNTCVYSDPKEEFGATQHVVETSNRRFRDDEFLVPRDLTAGRKAIRVRIKFTPVRTPLYPGYPLAELAWSEIRYAAYCWVMPSFQLP